MVVAGLEALFQIRRLRGDGFQKIRMNVDDDTL